MEQSSSRYTEDHRSIDVEWAEKQAKAWDELDKEGKDFAIKRGNKIIKLSPEEDARWLAKAQPIVDEYIANMKKKGLPGEEVVKFYRERIKYYKTKK
jgi:TRAP-type C4-dicarboxylate transport system substrate-binding protein